MVIIYIVPFDIQLSEFAQHTFVFGSNCAAQKTIYIYIYTHTYTRIYTYVNIYMYKCIFYILFHIQNSETLHPTVFWNTLNLYLLPLLVQNNEHKQISNAHL
jgi:hypothetical protein